jgi:hypothetical protein
MAAGDRDEAAAAAAPLLAPARGKQEGCPGCRLEEINMANTSIPYRNFFYVWVVCLCAGKIQSPFPLATSQSSLHSSVVAMARMFWTQHACT